MIKFINQLTLAEYCTLIAVLMVGIIILTIS